MEQYGGVPDGKPSDPSLEWTTTEDETGLEEPMWQLGLGSGTGGGGGGETYPERPQEADCIYYLRTGSCGYGARCRFNHPRNRTQVFGAAGTRNGEYPERAGQPLCQYYMRTGTCKYGASCKYNHPRQAAGSPTLVALNYYGYPLRPGEKECSYYAKTWECKFGVTCKFHHPQPEGIHIPTPSVPLQVTPSPASVAMHALYPPTPSQVVPSPQQYGVIVPRPSMPPSYVQSPYGPLLVSPSIVSYPGWSSYQGPPPCVHHVRGECKFGAACKFDHSMGVLTYSPSASLLAEMPIVPYPVVSPDGMSAPFVSTSGKDSTSMGMNTSAVSSGSVPSVTMHNSRSSSQHSSQTTGNSAGEENRNMS